MANEDGTNILLKVGGQTLSGLVTQGLDFSVDEIDITTKDSSGNKEFLAGEFSGTFSAEGKLDESDSYGFEYLRTTMVAKAAVAWISGGTTAGDVTYSGSAIVTGLSQSSPKNAERTWSATFRITGAVTKGSVTTTP